MKNTQRSTSSKSRSFSRPAHQERNFEKSDSREERKPRVRSERTWSEKKDRPQHSGKPARGPYSSRQEHPRDERNDERSSERRPSGYGFKKQRLSEPAKRKEGWAKPNHDNKRGQRPGTSFKERPRSDRPHADHPRSDRPRDDRPRDTRPHNDRPRNDRPRDELRTSKGASSFKRKPKFEAAFAEYKSNPENVMLWGLHAVRAAWLNPKRRCFRVWFTEAGQKAMESAIAEGKENLLKRPDAKVVERHELDRLTPPGSVHQGIVMEAGFLPELSLRDIITGDTPPDLLIMLDQVTDPHNIGAILRSSAAFGAGAVIMTERNAPGVTGVLAKSASGAAEHIPQVHVVNLARALDELQEAGYWRVGLAEEGTRDLSAVDLSGRTVLVLGAEGEGLRQLTRKKCDDLAKLPTGGPIGSLNVSNAAAVALYEVRRQKQSFPTT